MAEILVDDDNVTDQLEDSKLVTKLQEELTPNNEQPVVEEPEIAADALPEKFRNKSVEDVIESYQNLEKQYGKHCN